MERKVENEFLRWSSDANKKPLLLYGPKQVGKTYSIIDFGIKSYKNIAYFDTTNNISLYNVFKGENNVNKIIMNLSILSGESIFQHDTLIVFDNCTSLAFIKSLSAILNDNQYDVVVITSQKDLLNKIKGTDFRYCSMHPMDFEEFLLNSQSRQLIAFIKDSYLTLKPMPFHQIAQDMYNDYLLTGGYPEVVKAYFNRENNYFVEAIKQKILNIYLSNINILDSNKTIEVINSLPYQIAKENHKFQYGLIKKGGRSKEYESSIDFLTINGIVNRSFKLKDIKSPLSSYKDKDSFKLYANDVGLLFTMMHLNKRTLLMDKGIRKNIIENNVANVLSSLGNSLYYYQSDGKAEISFVIQNKLGKIIPIEVVDMRLTKAKSLSLFLNKYNIIDAVRITEDNFSKKKNIRYIPSYATFCLKDL